ncbi:hypothetical protein VARIO8X_60340 [Burkholderiales bacterium 8X]|nr:hypothetical protein VARIO8X_60340 [Burkholderiales bacterium 8X]
MGMALAGAVAAARPDDAPSGHALTTSSPTIARPAAAKAAEAARGRAALSRRGRSALFGMVASQSIIDREYARNEKAFKGFPLKANILAEWTGLEPATPGVTGRYSNQLNYHSW